MDPEPVRLFDVLKTDRFTLLFVNLNDSEATHKAAQATLAPWRSLFETVSVRSKPGLEQEFDKVLGTAPALILIRPDGYATFTDTPDDMESLAAFLNEWFPQKNVSSREVAQ